MRSLSPSSRLVLAATVLAVLGLSIRGWVDTNSAGQGASGLAASPSAHRASEAAATSASGPVSASGSSSSLESMGPAATLTPPSVAATSEATAASPTCKPTDQDQYVYNPGRLEVLAQCVRVTGTVQAVRKEADGDLHILLALDQEYAGLLRPANQGQELGDLVVEPVCARPVTQVDAAATCATDPDPLSAPFPVAGARVWMEGRYVLDLDHGAWAELHPLYRWEAI